MRAGLTAVLRPNTTVTITPPANSQVIGSTCSPKNSAEKPMVKKICNSWIWLTRAMPPMASPAYQAKKPMNCENSET